MKTILGGTIVVFGLAVAVVRAAAHHSFAAEYDANKPIRVEGIITKMAWTNPHAWLYVNVKGRDGSVKNWKIEFGGPNGLYRQGWRPTDLPVGILVIVDGFLARDGTPTVNATDVTLPDGRKLFARAPGTGAPGTSSSR